MLFRNSIQRIGWAFALFLCGCCESLHAEQIVDAFGDPLPTGAIARLGSLRFRHEWPVVSASFSPDGKTLVSIDRAGTIRIWNYPAGTLRSEIKSGLAEPLAIHLSQDGISLTCATYHAIYSVKVASGESHKLFDLDADGTNCAAFSRTGSIIIFRSAGKWILRRVPSGQVIDSLKSSQKYLSGKLSFSADDRYLAVIHESSFFVFDLQSKQRIFEKLVDGAKTEAIAFSSRSPALVTYEFGVNSKDNHGFQFWKVPEFTKLTKIKSNQGIFTAFQLAADGETFAKGHDDMYTPYCQLRKDQNEKLILCGARADMRFSPDGKSMVLYSSDRQIHIWDADRFEELKADGGLSGLTTGVGFSDDGKNLALTAERPSFLKWSLADHKVLHTTPQLHSARTHSLSPDGTIAIMRWPPDDGLFLVSTSDGKRIERNAKNGNDFLNIGDDVASFSPDGRYLLASSGRSESRDSKGNWQQIPAKLEVKELKTQTTSYHCHFMQSAGEYRLLGSEKVVAIVELEKEKPGCFCVKDLSTNFEWRCFHRSKSKPSMLEVSPDGKWIACGDFDGNLTILDVANSFKSARSISVAKGRFGCCTFSRDSALFAVVTEDQRIQIWDTKDFHLVSESGKCNGTTHRLDFDPGNRHLIAPQRDGTVLVFLLSNFIKAKSP